MDWIRRFLLIVTFACLAPLASAAEQRPLKLGIMPFNSALALMKTHQPLRLHLEKTLGRPIEIFTSADYFTFINELLDGRFDIAIAGPHFASMAIDRGWSPLVRYKADLQPVFVVRPASGIRGVRDLLGKRVGLSSRLSISSIGGVRWLEDNGLRLDRDYRMFERATHGAAIAAVAVGELDAALTTHTPLKQVPEDVRAKVEVLTLDIHVPHLMTIGNPALGTAQAGRIREAFKAFQATPEGAAFFKDTGYEGYIDITPANLRELKPYVDLTLRMMKQR